MMHPVDLARKVAKGARPSYMTALAEIGPLLDKYQVNSPLRAAHFFAQGFHECDGLTILRESGAYSASRIMQIFGVGKHSAKVTQGEAKRLAGDGPALFERVYGQGNPSKARELGNTTGASGNYPGDGWWFRGNGFLQTTGRGAHKRLGQKVGLGTLFEDDPDKVTSVAYAFLPALEEWKESGCNALADKNDIAGITKRINGGYNGLEDRKAWFNKIYPLLRDSDDGKPAWQAAEADDYIQKVQEQLIALGYDLGKGGADGRKGPATESAIRKYQANAGIPVDGVAGPVTRESLAAAVAAPVAAIRTNPMPGDSALKSGAVQGGVAAAAASAGGVVMVAKEVKETVDDAKSSVDGTVIGFVFFGIFLVGGLLLIWNRYRQAGKLPKWLGGTA